MRPVPVVLLLLAFWPHSTAERNRAESTQYQTQGVSEHLIFQTMNLHERVLAPGYPQLAQVAFCLWKET